MKPNTIIVAALALASLGLTSGLDPLKALQLADPRSATTAPTTRQ